METMMTSRQKKQILRLVEDELNKNPLPRNATQAILAQGSKFQEGVRNVFAIIADSVLKLLSFGSPVIIDAVDGSETLSKAKEMFAWIDSDFIGYGADEVGPATKETPVAVYEMAKDTTFAEIFGSLGQNLDRLCLTQAQIKNFVKKHRNWLRTDGYGTFFLFKSKNNFFVARVGLDSDGGLGVGVGRFEVDSVWYAGYRHRVVVPQLV